MGSLWQDAKHGARMLRRNPAFTTVVVLTLALGIGANTAIFSVVHAVVLKPLPYPEADRLVVVHTVREGALSRSERYSAHSNSVPDYEDFRAQRDIFERMALFAYWTFNLTGRAVPERIVGARVTGEFFPALAARPLLGRTLTPEDDQPGTPEVVVLSLASGSAPLAATAASSVRCSPSRAGRMPWSASCRRSFASPKKTC